MPRMPAVRDSVRPAIRAAKLAPPVAGRRTVPADLRALLAPRAGRLVLVHAAAGYRKSAALAATQEPGWLWYNLDLGDRCPRAFGDRLCAVLAVEPLPPGLPAAGDPVARELAARLRGRPVTITLDRYEHVGRAPELGVLLSLLPKLAPDLAVRLATRVRPGLPPDRTGRPPLDVGPAELRLRRREIEDLLAAAWGSPPARAQVDYADAVLCGWPAAVQLWQSAGGGDLDPLDSVRPGRPLRDYLEEEVLPALASTVGGPGPCDVSRLPWPGAPSDLTTTPEQRELADRLVEDRVGVVLDPGGWRLHPLVAAVVGARCPTPRSQGGADAAPAAGDEPGTVAITAFGRLVVTVNGRPIDESALPCAPRRLLELLLCLPGGRVTSEQAALLLWPRHLRRSALNAFSVALHVLRRVLEPDLRRGTASRYLVREGRAFRLCLERMACDVAAFRELVLDAPVELDAVGAALLEEALRRYRGDFLASTAEEFAREPRAALREQAVATLDRLGAWHASAGRWPDALVAYHRLLELEPRREDVWARAVECHLATGDRDRAADAVRRWDQGLRALGVEPGGLLRDLRGRVLG